MKEAKYSIKGKIPSEAFRALPTGITMKVYAVRDRKVIGSSAVEKDGSFIIIYSYDVFENKKKTLAIAPALIFGPDLPGDQILRYKFPRTSLLPKDFSAKDETFTISVSTAIIGKIVKSTYVKEYIVPWLKHFFIEWRPCVHVLGCSRINGSLCYDEEPVSKAHVRIYEIRIPYVKPLGTNKIKETVLVAEGDTDIYGYFRTTMRYSLCIFPIHLRLGYVVEVGWIVDGVFQSVYKDPDTKLRKLESDLCEDIHIDKWKVISPDIPEILTGNVFKFDHIGNIPVKYLYTDPTKPFHGYANTTGATDSATLKVVDSAFFGIIKFYANIGDGIKDIVKFYRIKWSYELDGSVVESFIRVPFYCVRESTIAEIPASGFYKTEYMGPDGDLYTYPNPYDTAPDKDWVYKGLVLVLDTRTLPRTYGKFTFTLEPLKADKITPIIVDNPADLSCTLLVDNTAPDGSIGEITGPVGSATSCGFVKLPFQRTESRICDYEPSPYSRKIVRGTITVSFTATDFHKNLYALEIKAKFGNSQCDSPVIIVGPGMRPLKNGCSGTAEYQHYNDVPPADHPSWEGRTDYCGKSPERDWDVCAYEFSLIIYKRLTNGEVAYPWWQYSKFITIIES